MQSPKPDLPKYRPWEKEVPKSVKSILGGWIISEGYDGLCCPGYDCSCSINDLMPCELPVNGLNDCYPGYLCEDGNMYLKKGEDK